MIKSGRNYSRMQTHDLAIQMEVKSESGQDYDVLIDNICQGGIRISYKDQIPVGTLLEVPLNPLTGESLKGTVRWSTLDSNTQRYRHGIEFLIRTPQETQVLSDFIKMLLTMLSKELVISRALDLFFSNLKSSQGSVDHS